MNSELVPGAPPHLTFGRNQGKSQRIKPDELPEIDQGIAANHGRVVADSRHPGFGDGIPNDFCILFARRKCAWIYPYFDIAWSDSVDNGLHSLSHQR